jgi:hypothetical protein
MWINMLLHKYAYIMDLEWKWIYKMNWNAFMLINILILCFWILIGIIYVWILTNLHEFFWIINDMYNSVWIDMN